MSVLIKGMEMPKSCWDCEVGGAKQMDNATCPFYSMEYWEQENYQDKIADGCPLVPVPPHGRLIDADALKLSHCKECTLYPDKCLEKTDEGCDWGSIYHIEHCAPTIIEAEEEE